MNPATLGIPIALVALSAYAAYRSAIVLDAALSAGAPAVADEAITLETSSDHEHPGRAPTTEAEADADPCVNGFVEYRQAVSYYAAGTSLLLEARQACGGRRSPSLELTDARLSIRRDGQVVERLRAPIARLAPGRGQLLLEGVVPDVSEVSDDESPAGCGVGARDALSVSLARGELRAPGFRLALASPEERPCAR